MKDEKPQNTQERRFCATGIEMRASEGGGKIFRGYAAKFNTMSNDFGGWKERIAPGFFDSVLGNDVRALRDHNPSLVLGRTISGTAKIGVDQTGLWFEYSDPNTTYSRDLAISIERGDVTQCSFAFSLPDGGDTWQKEGDGYVRTLLNCERLYDVSVVTYPAYEDTSVAQRSFNKIQIPDGIEDANKDLAEMDMDMMRLQRI